MTTPNPVSRPRANTSNKKPNTLYLVSTEASKITNISLYSGRAEITRSFKLALTEGQNQITIRGLPQCLQKDSVRVEGRGNASIHDVVISKTPLASDTETTSAGSMYTPDRKQQELKNQIASIKHARAVLDAYLGAFNAEKMVVSELVDRFASHALLARKLDNEILDLEQALAEQTESAKKQRHGSQAEAMHLPWQVAIDVWAQADEEEATILIVYAVDNADWAASYDIRADTRSSGKNVTIHYKASIRQDTGEPWVGVPLTLETVTPAFEMVSPSLSPWIIAARAQPGYVGPGVHIVQPQTAMPAYAPIIIQDRPSRSSSRSRSRSRTEMPVMQHRPVIVATDKGDVTATFRIPGRINVPSDAQQHNVTISSFEFNAPLLWHTVPKASARVYMEAKIKNESEYAFIPGPANLYVDGSFVATTSIPAVSPQETFNCPMGLDSSLRVTYHRQEVNNSVTGFYKKSTTKTYTQRITIANTKSAPIANLKVVDIIPVSQDERIEIKLLNPPLRPAAGEPVDLQRTTSMASAEKDSTSKEQQSKSDRTRVSPGVVARWDGAGDPEANQDVVGRNGRVRWDVSLRPQETVNLVLKFEVSYPEKLVVEDRRWPQAVTYGY